MSALAAGLVLHPKISQALALLATTTGRDKVYRLIQYVSRLLAWSLARRGYIETAARFEGLKMGMTSGRRVLRLFRPAEFLQSAMNLAQRPITNLQTPGQIAHLAQVGRQVCYAGFFTSDMFAYLGGISFLKYDKAKIARFQRRAYQFWLLGMLLSLSSSVASLTKLRADSRRFALSNELARREANKGEKTPEDRVQEEEERRAKGRAMLAQRQTLLSQVIMDSLDVWIPLSALGYTNLSEGTLGFLGATTSYMGLQLLWRKHAAAGMRKSA